jgi:small subunit ribosomal protein S15
VCEQQDGQRRACAPSSRASYADVSGTMAHLGCSAQAPAAARSACFTGRSLAAARASPAQPARAVVAVTATAKRSRPPVEAVATFQAHAKDTGSAEVQTALLTKRIDNLTEHLKEHDTDYACQRGLRMLLGQRTRLLRYVYDQDKTRYFNLVSKLGIRKTVKNA